MTLKNFPLFLHWANTQILQTLQDTPGVQSKALSLFSHLLADEHIWLTRLRGDVMLFSDWPEMTPADCYQLLNRNTTGYRHILAERDLQDTIAYSDFDGLQYQNSVETVLMHVLSHGSYIRGEIAQTLQQENIFFPPLDYVNFNREALSQLPRTSS